MFHILRNLREYSNTADFQKQIEAEQVNASKARTINELMALALNKALEKNWDYDTIAEYGNPFSWNTIAKEYITLYKDIYSKHEY